MSGEATVAPIREDHASQVRALFEEVFGHPMSPRLWQWKYGQGRGGGVGVWRANRLIAHCGWLYREVSLSSVRYRFPQIIDLMVHPRERGGGRRLSPFYRAVDGALSAALSEKNPLGEVFGFPSERAMRLGEHLGVFAESGQVRELIWRERPSRRIETCELYLRQEWGGGERRVADRLWGAMAAEFPNGVIGVRDSEYLRWRYLEHPEHQYQTGFVRYRIGHRALALVVLRVHGARLELLDIIAPRQAVARTVTLLRTLLPTFGCETLVAWVSRSYRGWVPAPETDQPLPVRVLGNARLGEQHTRRYYDRWWLSAGDTDYR